MVSYTSFLLTKDRKKKKVNKTNRKITAMNFKSEDKFVQEFAWHNPTGASEEAVGSLSLEIFKICLDKGLSNLL